MLSLFYLFLESLSFFKRGYKSHVIKWEKKKLTLKKKKTAARHSGSADVRKLAFYFECSKFFIKIKFFLHNKKNHVRDQRDARVIRLFFTFTSKLFGMLLMYGTDARARHVFFSRIARARV